MSDMGNLDDVGDTLGYYRRRREGLGNFLLGVLVGVAAVIGLLLVIVGIVGPGAISLPFLSSPTPSPTISPTITLTWTASSTPEPTVETPAETPTPECPAEYVLQQNEYLSTVADRCGISLEVLLAANPSITDPNDVQAGDTIHLPPSGTGFTPTALPADIQPGATIDVMVMAGDTLTGIAVKYLSTVDDIKRLNKMTDAQANALEPGKWLKVRYNIATPVPIRVSPTFGPTPTRTPTLAPTPALT
jgi:LysM repeat protein